MISNFDIENICFPFNLNVVVLTKDQLKKIPLHSSEKIDMNFIINMQNSNDGNGTHWIALRLKNNQCSYFDSFGMVPPQEIVDFCKRIVKSSLTYSTKQIQHMKQTSCGFYCIAFLIFTNQNKNKNIFSLSNSFLNMFYIDTIQNNKILQEYFTKQIKEKINPSSYHRIKSIMEILFSQK